MMGLRVICIVGPTASGKTAFSEQLAIALKGEIVSVDAMQVYRGMDIGTAKTRKEESPCPLHMIDLVSVHEDYSVACFQRDARACVDEIAQRGSVPILCGGTGLYLDAVIDEMSFPTGSNRSAARARYEKIVQDEGPLALHRLLDGRDHQSAALIHPNNVRRVVRALEMLDEGVSYAEHHKGLKSRLPHYDARIWGIDMPREQLYSRIEERVEAMFANGLVDEVARLDAQGIRESQTARQAIGYKEVLAYLDGDLTLEETVQAVMRNTKRYAKRQLSWLRRDGRVQWISVSQIEQGEALEMICRDWSNNSDANVSHAI